MAEPIAIAVVEAVVFMETSHETVVGYGRYFYFVRVSKFQTIAKIKNKKKDQQSSVIGVPLTSIM